MQLTRAELSLASQPLLLGLEALALLLGLRALDHNRLLLDLRLATVGSSSEKFAAASVKEAEAKVRRVVE